MAIAIKKKKKKHAQNRGNNDVCLVREAGMGRERKSKSAEQECRRGEEGRAKKHEAKIKFRRSFPHVNDINTIFRRTRS